MWFLKRTQEEDFTEDTLVNSQEFSYDDETNYAAQSLVNLSDRASQRIKGTIQGEKRLFVTLLPIGYTPTNWQQICQKTWCQEKNLNAI